MKGTIGWGFPILKNGSARTPTNITDGIPTTPATITGSPSKSVKPKKGEIKKEATAGARNSLQERLNFVDKSRYRTFQVYHTCVKLKVIERDRDSSQGTGDPQ
jgi:hypothetical protein